MRWFFIILLLSLKTYAQIDQKASVWVPMGSDTASFESSLDSGRYQPLKGYSPLNPKKVSGTNKTRSLQEFQVEDGKLKSFKDKEASRRKPASIQIKSSKNSEEMEPPSPPSPSAVAPFEFREEAKAIERGPVFHLEMAPFFAHTNANSNFQPRNFNVRGGGLFAEAKLWLLESWAADFSYARTLGSEISDISTAQNKVSQYRQWIEFKIHYRPDKTRQSVEYMLGIGEWSQGANLNSQGRVSYRSKGLVLGIMGQAPVFDQYNWMYSLSLAPFLSHVENSGLTGLSSGENPTTHRLAAALGGKRAHDGFFIRLKWDFEQTKFKGLAQGNSTVITQASRDVSANESVFRIELGYIFQK